MILKLTALLITFSVLCYIGWKMTEDKKNWKETIEDEHDECVKAREK